MASIGGPGWDKTETSCHTRAKELLQKSGVGADVLSCMASMFRPDGLGSLVEVHSVSAGELQLAKSKVRCVSLCWQEGRCRGPAWLDVKKTHSERQPGRRVKQLHDLLDETIDKSAGDWSEDSVEVNQRVRVVSVKGIKVVSWTGSRICAGPQWG